MATAAALFSHLRRSRQSPSLSLLFMPRVLTPQPTPLPPPLPPPLLPTPTTPVAPLGAFRSRLFSTRSSSDDGGKLEMDSYRVDAAGDSPAQSELLKVISDAAAAGSEHDLAPPVRSLIWMLDAYHDFSGFPWWITIVTSTLDIRIVLLFPLIFTLHKAKRIGELLPK